MTRIATEAAKIRESQRNFLCGLRAFGGYLLFAASGGFSITYAYSLTEDP